MAVIKATQMILPGEGVKRLELEFSVGRGIKCADVMKKGID